MKMKNTVPVTLAFASLLCSCQEEKSQDPNVLFILVDDMQSDAIATLGNSDVSTPNIDSIIDEGVCFNNTYTNGALCGALSMPSRAMLLTGRGVFDIQSDGMKIPEQHTTFPEHFRANGYTTFGTGKWHSDFASFNRSFSEGDNIFFGGMHPYEQNGHLSPKLHHYDPKGRYQGTSFRGEEFSSKMFADATIDFLERQEEGDTPFLAYVAFTSPHDPRNQLPDYGEKYVEEELSLPINYLPSHPFDNGELKVRDEVFVPAPRSKETIKRELSLYYGMVSEVDLQIGRILDTLKSRGLDKNTIIVFASDNGLAMGQNGLIGKQNLYNHSVRVPLAILDMREERPINSSDALCYLYDVYPTLCDIAGLKTPESVKGRSLQGVMHEEVKGVRDDLFLIYSSIQRGLVKDGFKYIIYNVDGVVTEQLFDLTKDPKEMDNRVIVDREIADKMKTNLASRLEEHGDFCSIEKPIWWSDGHKINWNELINLYIFDGSNE